MSERIATVALLASSDFTAEQHDRFLSKTFLSGDCWIWTGSKNSFGHGFFSVSGRAKKAHRVSYEMHVGPIPPGAGYHGTCVLHRCDVPACVNPEHLFTGSAHDNSKDMVAKRRQARGASHSASVKAATPRGVSHGSHTRPERKPVGDRNGSRTKPESRPRGERHWKAKLTAKDVLMIRELRSQGWTFRALSRRFEISPGHARSIAVGASWRGVRQ